MPIVAESTYKCPLFLGNGHVQTCLSTFLRRAKATGYSRQRIDTPDGDFLDLDWIKNGSPKLAVLAHGLEGDSQRPYILGMVNALAKRGWDALPWNARGCSGEPNRVLRFTHSGATEDLETVISHVTSSCDYQEIALIGFSLGGNLALKYVGERGSTLDPRIKAAVAFSVPCDLESGSLQLARPRNRIYMRRFLASLHVKIRALMKAMPGTIDDQGYERMRTFKDFDDRYTAPIHGFENAEDYWRRSSCKPFLRNVQIPTLLINARNDPFLAEQCYPVAEAERNSNLYLEVPDTGGHVGFMGGNHEGEYWTETRATEFLAQVAAKVPTRTDLE